MKNVKIKIATTVATIALSFASTAFAGDAAMHMDFYLEDKVTEPTTMVVNNELIRAEPIRLPVITSNVEQQPVVIDYVAVKPEPTRVYQQRIYSVRAGDTLMKVSRKTGISVLELARLNQIKFKDLNHIQIGQKLKLI